MKYIVEVNYPNDNLIELDIPKELWNRFENGEVFYNGNSFGDPYNFNESDFEDDSSLFILGDTVEKSNLGFVKTEEGWMDEEGEGEQNLYSYDCIMSSFSTEGPYETKRGTMKFYLGC